MRRVEKVRLTIRMPEDLDELLRAEALLRGTNINQTMIYILNQYIYSPETSMAPNSSS